MEAVASEHLRLNAVYWGLCCLELLQAPEDTLDRPALRAWVLSCQDTTSGGFAPAPGHDTHVLSTLSAVQVLALLGDSLLSDHSFRDSVSTYLARLQRADGSFVGDTSLGGGEVDTRFTYAALCCASLLRVMYALDVRAAVAYIHSCANFDGGFGATPGGESHAGQVFTCCATLALASADARHETAVLAQAHGSRLGAWLAARQVPGGGLNGRPEKAPDVCYSWWVLSSLTLLRRLHWIDAPGVTCFVLHAQDGVKGGIADRADDEADVYHTFFGVAGLSLLGHSDVAPMDAATALPVHTLQRLGISCGRTCVG
jgi:geranylgeranyl transferase type-2 subunit beta